MTALVRSVFGAVGTVAFHELQAGVSIENCQRPALKPARGSATTKTRKALPTQEQSDACGRCHRTWAGIAVHGPRGADNGSFPPSRIADSKSYGAADRRIARIACHDPHAALETNAKAYGNRCGSYHSAQGDRQVCSKGERANCVSCPMARYEIPGSHHLFTDHWIRIVRPNETYPN